MKIDKITKGGKDIILEKIESGCVICKSHCTDKDGYVRIRRNQKHDRLHRVLYEMKYGEIPKGMVIRHKCDNPSCCNIDHLEIGTVKDNVRDMIERGRDGYHKPNLTSRGTKSKFNKLSEEQVKEIFLSSKGYRSLSRIYGVSSTNIMFIKKQMSWKWFTDTLMSESDK